MRNFTAEADKLVVTGGRNRHLLHEHVFRQHHSLGILASIRKIYTPTVVVAYIHPGRAAVFHFLPVGIGGIPEIGFLTVHPHQIIHLMFVHQGIGIQPIDVCRGIPIIVPRLFGNTVFQRQQHIGTAGSSRINVQPYFMIPFVREFSQILPSHCLSPKLRDLCRSIVGKEQIGIILNGELKIIFPF